MHSPDIFLPLRFDTSTNNSLPHRRQLFNFPDQQTNRPIDRLDNSSSISSVDSTVPFTNMEGGNNCGADANPPIGEGTGGRDNEMRSAHPPSGGRGSGRSSGLLRRHAGGHPRQSGNTTQVSAAQSFRGRYSGAGSSNSASVNPTSHSMSVRRTPTSAVQIQQTPASAVQPSSFGGARLADAGTDDAGSGQNSEEAELNRDQETVQHQQLHNLQVIHTVEFSPCRGQPHHHCIITLSAPPNDIDLLD